MEIKNTETTEKIPTNGSVSWKNQKVILQRGDEEIQLFYDRMRIVKTPGYEIYLEHVDNAVFYEDNSCLHLLLKRGHYEKDVILGCK